MSRSAPVIPGSPDTTLGRGRRVGQRRRARVPRPALGGDEIRQPCETRPSLRGQPLVPFRRRQQGRRRPDRPTDEDAARPGATGDPHLALEGRVVDAARQEHPRDRRCRIELRAGVGPATLVRRRPGRYGNSAFSTSPPSAVRRRAVSTTTRRRSSPTSFGTAGSMEKPSGSMKRARSAVDARRGDLGDETLLVRRARGVGVVVDEELRRVGAHALGLRDAPARRGPGSPGPSTSPRTRSPRWRRAIPPRTGSDPSAMHWAAPISGSSRTPSRAGRERRGRRPA